MNGSRQGNEELEVRRNHGNDVASLVRMIVCGVVVMLALVLAYKAFMNKAVNEIRVKRPDGTEIAIHAPKNSAEVISKLLHEDHASAVAILNQKGFFEYTDPRVVEMFSRLDMDSAVVKALLGRCIDREMPFKPVPKPVALQIMDNMKGEAQVCDRSDLSDKSLLIHLQGPGTVAQIKRAEGTGIVCPDTGGEPVRETIWIGRKVARELQMKQKKVDDGARAVVLYSVRVNPLSGQITKVTGSKRYEARVNPSIFFPSRGD